ncbi:Fe(3+)-hydroxamate ABC transporter permease FhuB [Paenibacillus sp. 1001270B_150601_E10]|uniref:Fe(3+)-hydroxamate ABC transporter permease FhuB n=1 Tax=Paenibacillus sp. 1001270B_150601_E10 TaxID=2787079 RepID=UPI00189D958E|nr:Fe(3+)-hydroxamate ABC transporter permease FhuB [Paenibacillus sp. 1001270B_150601_E10]
MKLASEGASASASINPAHYPSEGKGWKPLWMLIAGVVALALLTFISLTQGLADITVQTVVQSLIHPQDLPDHQMIRAVRLPRTVMGLLSGAALAISGALMQTVTRNPLASETTLGVNAGAYLAVVASTIFWPAMLHQFAFPIAVLGGTLSAGLVFILGGGRKASPIRIALSGMIVTLVLSSITSALLMLNQFATKGLFLWGSGSLIQNDWDGVQFAWPWILGGTLLILFMARQLDLLTLSEETAKSLGQNVARTQLFAMLGAIIIACVSVSIVGPIGFVGLIAPHLVRLSGVRKHAWLIPLCAVWGAAVLVGADTLSRTIVDAYGELPAGAITAAIGAPWLIWLAVRTSGKGGGGQRAGDAMAIGGLQQRIPFGVYVWIFSLLLIVVWVLSLTSGAMPIPLSDLFAVITGGGNELNQQILFDFRLPRLLTAGFAGIAIAASGSLLQSAIRNPLGDPQIVGVTSGAGAGALLLLIAFPSLPVAWVPAGAMAGGLLAAAIVYAVSWRSGLQPTTLTLVGIAVSAAGSAVINILIVKADLAAAPALAWMAGSIYGREWTEVRQLLITIVLLLPIAWWLGRKADLLSFGDEVASGVGLSVRRTRLIVAVLAVILSSVAAACVGVVGFIGLLAPHAARMLVGHEHRKAFVISCLLGGLLLAISDWIGRVIMIPNELPAGIVAALIGTPYLVFLMYRTSRTKAS